jgi:hypothetical protein
MKRLLLALTLVLFSYAPAKAEVSSPYIVDEKSKVLFGDSSEIIATSTYQGLENYVHDYVEGFLHLSFTYTHAGCCFASYPPALYITSSDPTSTTTLSVKSFYPIYRLISQPTHLSGLYLYDVQFDETGYEVVVKQDEITEIANFHNDIADITQFDWVALANGHPRQSPINDFSMSFAPLPIREIIQISSGTTTPVIVVPGISSTYLIKDNNPNLEAWINAPQMLLSINDSYLDEISLPDSFLITAKSIIRESGGNDFFTGLFRSLDSNGFVENESAYEFPYDWRNGVSDSSSSLKNKIEEVKVKRGVNKVDLIAHSMGGLVVKKYLKDYGGNSVGKFIDIGTPHTGAPKAFKILSYGDDFGASFLFGLVGLNSEKVRSISQNMPSIYELLPSNKYFLEEDSDYRYYVANLSGEVSKYDFSGTKGYLNSIGRNQSLIERADVLHQEIDTLNPANYGVETYNIVGCGTPTIGQFYILDGNVEHPIYNIKMINGDGTVPLKSATSLNASTTYYLKNAIHALMPSANGVKELVAALLTASGTAVDISQYPNLSLNYNGCTIPNGKIVSFHSPIELHVYDQNGNHSGPNAEGEIENNITNISYESVGDNKFVFLPDGQEYSVKGRATGTGSFDIRVQEVIDGEVATTTIFANIPLTMSTQVKFDIGSTLLQQVFLDADKDGIYENNTNFTIQLSGLIEGTGKPVFESAIESKSRRSHKTMATTTEHFEEIVSTTIDVATATKVTSNKAVLSKSPTTLQSYLNATSVKREVTYSNSAFVYKSFGQKFTLYAQKAWSWIKSKL